MECWIRLCNRFCSQTSYFAKIATSRFSANLRISRFPRNLMRRCRTDARFGISNPKLVENDHIFPKIWRKKISLYFWTCSFFQTGYWEKEKFSVSYLISVFSSFLDVLGHKEKKIFGAKFCFSEFHNFVRGESSYN